MGEGMQRIGQPAIMGQLLAGVLLGPSVFGALGPELQHAIFPRTPEQRAMIGAVSQRPGDTLDFGGVPAAVLARSGRSLLFLAS